MFNLIQDSSLSAEEFGELIGISGMTIRRWLDKPQNESIPKLYVPAIKEACYSLLAKGTLSPDSGSVQAILSSAGDSSQYQAAMKNLGLNDIDIKVMSSDSEEQWLLSLSKIGSQADKKKLVNESGNKILSYKSISKDWSLRISSLACVIRSKKLNSIDKLVAYGALFYLITPIDLIPDSIPIFGLLDDFWMLGLAAAYYAKRFAEI